MAWAPPIGTTETPSVARSRPRRRASVSSTALSLMPSTAMSTGTLDSMVNDRRTKIVATIGPSSETPEQLRALVAAGMNAARLNLSHGTHEEHARRGQTIREVEADTGWPIALIADGQGPKLRSG